MPQAFSTAARTASTSARRLAAHVSASRNVDCSARLCAATSDVRAVMPILAARSSFVHRPAAAPSNSLKTPLKGGKYVFTHKSKCLTLSSRAALR